MNHLRRLIGLVVIALLLTAWGSVSAQHRPDVVALPVDSTISGIKMSAAVRPAEAGALDPATLLISDAGFEPYTAKLEQDAPPLWLKLRVAAPVGGSDEYVLRVSRRFFKTFAFHAPAGDGRIERLAASYREPVTAETVGRHYAFGFRVPPGQTQTLLIHVDTVQGNLSPLEISLESRETFAQKRSGDYLVYGLLFGALIALIFHNFILYLNLRQRGHLFYVFAMVSLLLLLGADSGLLQTHILPEFAQAHTLRLYVVFSAAMLVTIGLFFQAFVDPRRKLPRLSRVTRILLGLTALVIPLTLLLPVQQVMTVTMLFQPLQLALQLLLLTAAFMAGRRGLTEGYIFFAAWLVFLLSGFCRVFITLGLLPRTDVLEYMIYFGAVVEASVLALGLTWRVRQLYRRHARAIEEQHKAARLANLDPLTDAYNRRFLQAYLEGVLPGAGADSFDRAVLILDLDKFKETNDEHGHAAGDYVLRELVKRCRRVLREGDVMCRLGGDEFVIVLSDQRDRNGLHEANRILAEVESEPFLFEGAVMPVTTSIGVVSSISPKCSVSDILRMADRALYQAKEAGRNRAVLFDPDRATPFRHGPSKTSIGQLP